MIAYTHRALTVTADVSAPGITRGYLRGAVRACLVLTALYFGATLLAFAVASSAPDAWERDWFDSGGPDPLQPEDTGRAAKVLHRLMEPRDLRVLRYRVYSTRSGGPNAWAKPGGAIFVSEALLKAVKTDIGLATVIAHELGHHERRHILSRMSRAVFVELPGGFLLGKLRLRVGQEAVGLAELSHGREQEHEADDYALRRVFRAYGTLEGSLEFYEFIATLEPEHSSAVRYLRTHPLTLDRIERLRRLKETLDRRPAPIGPTSGP
jgi:Zn-dependent protease with chaperone function